MKVAAISGAVLILVLFAAVLSGMFRTNPILGRLYSALEPGAPVSTHEVRSGEFDSLPGIFLPGRWWL